MDQKSENFINEIIENIDKESFRYDVLETARRFKNNWYELGKKLTEVATQKLYEKWGYRSFEDYCRLEIRIRNSTAMKLTNAYFFLKEESLSSSSEEIPSVIPDIKSVELLKKAKSNEHWTDEMYNDFRTMAFNETSTPKLLSRKYEETQKATGIQEAEKKDWKKPISQTKNLKTFLESIHAKKVWIDVLAEIEIFLQQKHEREQIKSVSTPHYQTEETDF